MRKKTQTADKQNNRKPLYKSGGKFTLQICLLFRQTRLDLPCLPSVLWLPVKSAISVEFSFKLSKLRAPKKSSLYHTQLILSRCIWLVGSAVLRKSRIRKLNMTSLLVYDLPGAKCSSFAHSLALALRYNRSYQSLAA